MKTILVVCLTVAVLYGVTADDYASAEDLTRDKVGCYLEKATDREFRVHATDYRTPTLTLGLCRARCHQQKYLYAAVQAGKFCFCGDSYGKHGTASTCTDKCPGDSTQTCGGALSNQVYKVPEVISGFHIIDIGSTAATYEPVEIKVNQTTGIEVKYVYNYHDGSLQSAEKTDQIHNHQFRKPGKMAVLATATDREKNVETDTTDVTVQTVVRRPELTCPTYEIVTKLFNCYLTVAQGTDMKIDIDLQDGRQFTQPPADAMAYHLGDVETDENNKGSSANIVYMMTNRIFQRAGTLVAWEFNVVTAGQLTFQIFRPNCAADKQFCFRSYSCIALTASCKAERNRWAKNCGSTAYYSLSKRVCISRETEKPVPEYFETFWTSFPTKNFKFVGEFATSTSTTGVHFVNVPVDKQIQVEKGDIMALFQTSGRVRAVLTPVVYEYYHSVGGNWGSRVASGYSFSNEMSTFFGNHLVRAHVVRPITFKFQHNYTKVDTYNITANISNLVTPGGVVASWEIDIQAVIDWVNFTSPFAWPTNLCAPITVNEHPGMLNKVNYTWDFGDGNSMVTTNMSIDHNFTKAGIYAVTVTANNHISSANFTAYIIIQDTIKDFVINPMQIATIFGEKTNINWTISQGTNVSYEIDMGDSKTYTLNFEHGNSADPETTISNSGHFGILSYAYEKIGYYNFHVNVSNLISWAEMTVKLPVQIPIEGLRIKPPPPIPFGEFVYIYLSMANGSHVTFTSDFAGNSTRVFNMSEITKTGWALIEPTDYPGIGNYTFLLTAENLVGPPVIEKVALWIDYPVKELDIVADQLCVKPDTTVNFKVSVKHASRLTLYADYGDSSGESLYKDLLLASRRDEVPLSHKFGPEGFYTTNITMENSVSSGNVTQEIVVQNPVEKLTLTTNSPIKIWPSDTGNATFKINYGGTLVPTDAAYVYNFGDKSNQTKPFMINSTHPVFDYHKYKTFGTYPLTLNASNCVSHVFIDEDIVVEEPVMNLQVQADPLFVKVGQYSNITVTVTWGSRFKITWDFDDGSNHKADYKRGKSNVVTHQFNRPKVYNVTITATNVVGTAVIFLDPPIIIQHPVDPTSFKLICETRISLISAEVNWLRKIKFKFYYDSSSPFPTDAFYVIYFGDGQETQKKEFKDPNPNAPRTTPAPGQNITRNPNDLMMEFEHGYIKGGNYPVTVRIFNLVADINVTCVHDIYEQIYELSKQAYSWDNITQTAIIGNGSDANYFPMEDAVLFRPNMTRGSHVIYHWDFGDGKPPQTVDHPDMRYKFTSPGTYTVTLNASNLLNWDEIQKTVHIQRGIYDVALSCDSPRPRNTTFSYQVDPGSIGTDACYMVDFLDTTSDDNYIRFYGDEDQCKASHPVEWKISPRMFTAYSSKKLEDRQKNNPKKSANFTVENVFQSIGAYEVLMTVSNKVMKVSTTWRTGVTKGPCWWPKVELLERNKCIEPLCASVPDMEYKIKKHYRSKILDVDSFVGINCTSTKIANFTWSCYKVNENTLKDGEEVDLTAFGVKTTGNSLRSLTIRALALEYGIYRFYLNVSMFEEFGINSVKYVEIKIVETPLQGTFSYGAFIRRKWNTNVTLDAISDVKDPDYPDDKSSFTFTFMCKRTCEDWPDFNDKNELISGTENIFCNKSSTALGSGYDGGCYRDTIVYVLSSNEGEVPTTASTNLNDSAGVYTLDTFLVREPDEIDIKVIVKKGNRKINLELSMEVFKGDPPTVEVKCVTNCHVSHKLDPLARFSLESAIWNWRRGMTFGYEWGLVRIPPGSGRNLISVPNDQWADKASTGCVSDNMAIDDLFTRHDAKPKGNATEPDNFLLTVKAWRMPGPKDNYGLSSYRFVVNEAPLPGNFSVEPPSGLALITEFNIQLQDDFVDQDMPFTYRVGYRVKKEDDITWLYIGNYPTLPNPTILPAGDPDNDNMIEMVLQGADAIGSTAQTSAYVMVENPDADMLSEVLTNYTADGGLLDNLVTAGDPSQASQVIGAVAIAFNDKVTNITVDMDEPNPPPAPTEEMSEEEITATELQYQTAMYFFNVSKQKAQKAVQIENLAIRKWMLVGCGRLAEDLQRVSDSKVLLSAVSQIVVRPEELDAEAQEAAVRVLDAVLNVVSGRGKIDGMSANEQEEVGKMLLLVAGEVLAAIQFSLSATSGDIPLPDGITVAPPTEEELQQKTLDEDLTQESNLLSASNRDRVMTILQKCSENLDSYKVAGEADTVIKTKNLDTVVKKQFTDRMDSAVLSPGPNSGNSFGLPDVGTMFGNGNETTHFVSAQTTRVKVNPYVQQNSSDSPIVGGVSGLSFKNDTGQDIDVADLEEPINMMLTREPGEVKILEIVNMTTPPDLEGVVHKISLPSDTALLFQIGEWFNITGSDDSEKNGTGFTTEWATTEMPETTESTITEASVKKPLTVPASFTIFIKFEKRLSMRKQDYDLNCTVPLSDAEMERLKSLYMKKTNETDEEKSTTKTSKEMLPDRYTCFFSNEDIDRNTTVDVYYTIKHTEGNDTIEVKTTVASETGDGSDSPSSSTFTPKYYSVKPLATACRYWSNKDQEWRGDGCRVGPLSSALRTQCLCTHLTQFGAGFVVPMNTIDVSDSAFLKLNENPIVFATMVCLMALYLVLVVWARKADKLDELKAGATPLVDNDPRDKYLYEITVYTGARKNGATTAKVTFILTGDQGDTGPRLLMDNKRTILQRGSIDSFVMAVSAPLGSLSHLRLWHDNSGSSPSWFFSRMQVTDMQTDAKFFFICDRWFAVEEDDGLIDRILPIAGNQELTSFNHLFWVKTRRNMTDGHIWFSVFNRPPKSNFTRVQRLSCCLSLLFCTMMANILFYGQAPASPDSGTYKIGPLSFTFAQVYIGFISALMVMPINIIVVAAFRYAKPPPPKKNKKDKTASKYISTEDAQAQEDAILTDELQKQKQFLETGDVSKRLLLTPAPGDHSAGISYIGRNKSGPTVKMTGKKEVKKKKKFQLPHWSIYIGYALCLASVGAAFYVTVEVAGGFGLEKAKEWLIAFTTSILESIFLMQPFKVLAMALVYALVIKKPDTEDDEQETAALKEGEQWMHDHLKEEDMKNPDVVKKLQSYKNAPLPPDEEYLKAARLERFKEIKMHKILREIFFYFVFLYLLMMVGFGNRDPWSFLMTKSYRDTYDRSAYDMKNSFHTHGFKKIRDRASFYAWSRDVLVPSVYGETRYSEDDKLHSQGFTADRTAWLVGMPRLRQLRIEPEKCEMPVYQFVPECRMAYTFFGQAEKNYTKGWILANMSDPSKPPDTHFIYHDAEELDGYPYWGLHAVYSGGGYVVELGKDPSVALETIKELEKNYWIDEYTRAVFIEFVTYNPNVNLFGVCLSVVEFMTVGGADPYFKFHVMRLDRYFGSFMFVVMGAEILSAVFIIFFIVREGRKIFKEKKDYFKEIWNVMEFVLIICCIVAIVMFMYRILISARVSNRIHELAADPKFVNFQYAIMWDEIYAYFLGFIIFFATVKFLKLLRFNKKMSMFGSTLRYAAKPLLSFFVVFMTVFLAFSQVLYLMLANLLTDFSTFIRTMETMFSMMLNKFDFYELREASRVWGPMLFFFFTLFVNFILINFFLTIMMEGYAKVCEDVSQQSNEYEIVEFMVDRFKTFTGIGEDKKKKRRRKEQNKNPGVESAGYVEGVDPDNQTAEDLRMRVDEMMARLEMLADIEVDEEQLKEEVTKLKRKSRGIIVA